MSERRKYDTALRDRLAAETRDRIIRGAAGVLAADVPDVSVPKVAAEAGVGIATVYRHFPTKADLVDAVYEHWMAGAREVLDEHRPQSLDSMLAVLSQVWAKQAEDPALERAMSLRSATGRSVRQRRRRRRRQVVVDLLADEQVQTVERRYLHALVLLLTSTAARQHMQDYWDLSTEEAAQAAGWAVRALVAAAGREVT